MATRKLTAEEAAALNPMPLGHRHPIRIMIEEMKPGEILLVERADFNWKGKSPLIFTNQLEKKRKGKFEVYKSGANAWIVKRIK